MLAINLLALSYILIVPIMCQLLLRIIHGLNSAQSSAIDSLIHPPYLLLNISMSVINIL